MYINVFCFISLVIFKSTYSKTYQNYTLYRAIPLNESHLIFLETLVDNYDVNLWKEVGMMHTAVDFVVHPDDKPDLLLDASKLGLKLETKIVDVQKAFDRQTVKPYIRRRMYTMDWRNYFRLNDIYGWLTDLSDAYPREVSLESIGKSHEGRDIMALRVLLTGSKRRSTVIIEGGIHAREWIAPAFVTYLISAIINARSSQVMSLKDIALTYEWYFVPILNPDGYEYSHTEDRLWRKNRNKVPVDLNRNFDAQFGTDEANNKWSDSYPGPRAFSENESSAMSAFVKSKSFNLEYYIAFHSYGEYMILPYGYSKEHLENYDEVYKMCSDAAKKIYEEYHTSYAIGNPYETVGYLTKGVSGCWVKKTFNVPYVITFELRDKGLEGFSLPPNKILPTCEETLNGVISLLSAKNNKYKQVKKVKSGQAYKILDQIVFVFNVMFFIIYELCLAAAKTIYKKYKTSYVIGTVYETVGYIAPGASACWVKKAFKIPYVIAFELRDKGSDGFALDTTKILPTCEETLEGVISLFSKRSSNVGCILWISNQIVILIGVLLFTKILFD